MNIACLIILLLIVVYILNYKDSEQFDIPMKPTALCEARCATDYDHAQLLQHGILAESCMMKCHNLL